jgi:hypothetical protein
MVLVQFDGRIREDRLIGFYVPTSILPGQTCSFQTTISQPAPPNGSPSTVYKIFTFTKVIPSDRKIVFTVPSDVPLGYFHFTIVISVISSVASASTSGTGAAAAATADVAPADETVA